eukprot:3311953-Pleurochrysis_carterae.AAC.5
MQFLPNKELQPIEKLFRAIARCTRQASCNKDKLGVPVSQEMRAYCCISLSAASSKGSAYSWDGNVIHLSEQGSESSTRIRVVELSEPASSAL